MMGLQTISTEFWEVKLPEGWIQVQRDPEEVVYFESPDQSAGVYLSTWRAPGQPLVDAMRNTRAIEHRNLPATEQGRWEVLRNEELDKGTDIEASTEYLNRTAQYRIVSRMLGRDGYYVRLTFHDYASVDSAGPTECAESVLASLKLRRE